MTTLRYGSATDVGKVRTNNEDQLLVAEPLFAVADGMGGHAAGEVAALAAVEALKVAFERHQPASATTLAEAVSDANRAVWERSAGNPDLHRKLMGYPDDLPDLRGLRPPGGNMRPEGVSASCHARRERGELPETY